MTMNRVLKIIFFIFSGQEFMDEPVWYSRGVSEGGVERACLYSQVYFMFMLTQECRETLTPRQLFAHMSL